MRGNGMTHPPWPRGMVVDGGDGAVMSFILLHLPPPIAVQLRPIQRSVFTACGVNRLFTYVNRLFIGVSMEYVIWRC